MPSTFVDTFTACEVFLLGVYELPSDLGADERQRRRIEAYHTLYSLADQFVQRDELAEVELVMGEDVTDGVDEVVEHGRMEARLVPRPITTLGRVLVPVQDDSFTGSLVDFLGTLNTDQNPGAHRALFTTLFHVAESESGRAEGRRLLEDVRDALVDADFPDITIDTKVVVDPDPSRAIEGEARDYDLLIVGEEDSPSVEALLSKETSVAGTTDTSTVLVRT